MPDISTISQGIQVGVEATPGTLVPANILFNSIGIEPSIDAQVQTFKPRGRKLMSLAALGRESTNADISGQGDYNELLYLLAGNFERPTTVALSAPAYKHTFTPSPTNEDDVVTLSVECGSTARAKRFAYGLINSLSFDISTEAFNVGGSMLGRPIEDDIAMTAAPTALPQRPLLGRELEVYLDTTQGALGTTRLDRYVEGSFNYSDRFGGVYAPIRANNGSFAAHVETDPTCEASIRLEADDQGMGLLGVLRSGSSRWLRWEYLGPVIAGTDRYRFRLDCEVLVSGVDNFSDADGVYSVGFTFAVKSLAAELVNTVASI